LELQKPSQTEWRILHCEKSAHTHKGRREQEAATSHFGNRQLEDSSNDIDASAQN
jgi:hypothetical protein